MSDKPAPYARVAASGEKMSLTAFADSDGAKAQLSLLPWDKNCVAMTLSRCLGVNLFTAVNFMKHRGWISKGTDLEDDSAIETVVSGLGMTERHKDKAWTTVRKEIPSLAVGRYFCINRGIPESTTSDHAFALIRHASGWNVEGNNLERKDVRYVDQIGETHRVSVYGPMNH